jgi:hypothetical protein
MTKWHLGPQDTISVEHDGDGWLLRADRDGERPRYFGAYAATARDAQWAAELFAEYGCRIKPLRLQ